MFILTVCCKPEWTGKRIRYRAPNTEDLVTQSDLPSKEIFDPESTGELLHLRTLDNLESWVEPKSELKPRRRVRRKKIRSSPTKRRRKVKSKKLSRSQSRSHTLPNTPTTSHEGVKSLPPVKVRRKRRKRQRTIETEE